MSKRNRKYYSVQTTQVVSANSKRDALAKATRQKGIDAEILATEIDGTRISAAEARSTAESAA